MRPRESCLASSSHSRSYSTAGSYSGTARTRVHGMQFASATPSCADTLPGTDARLDRVLIHVAPHHRTALERGSPVPAKDCCASKAMRNHFRPKKQDAHVRL